MLKEGGWRGKGDDGKEGQEDRTGKRSALSINFTESHIKAMENNNQQLPL